MKLIQIRGSNGSGKTTMMKQFVEKHNLEIKNIDVGGIPTDISTNQDMSIIVLGKYNKKTGGCDLYKNKEHISKTIYQVVKDYRPKILLFEGLIYGLTYKFAKTLADTMKKYGYDYKGICLYLEPELAIKRVLLRNGGKSINHQAIYDKTKSFLASYEKLKKDNYNVKMINTGNVNIENMVDILEREIND